ncbi:MAG: hydroxymethylbilane synthase [Acidobacteria bacterium]|nr:hydroxymethylbilane synthase [Acidobacteriota bacterium]
MRSRLTLGSRGSPLALWQANFIKATLERAEPVEVRIEVIRTTGDKITDVPLAQAGGSKALFTKEIEEALLEKRIDLAVHSLKDLPVELPRGLVIAAIPEREDARDALVSRSGKTWSDLPAAARVGTSSLRRQAQLRLLRKDLAIEPLRGNVDTRLRKLDEGRYDAIVLALAGLKRMGWPDRATQIFSVDEMVPAIGQGALAIEARSDDAELLAALSRLSDPDTEAATRAERAFLARLGGGCQVPLAGHAQVKGESLELMGVVVSADGSQAVRGTERGAASDARALGEALAERLLRQGAREILAAIEEASLRLPGSA